VFCSKCAKEIDEQAIVCPACGVATANYHRPSNQQQNQPNIVITNANTNTNKNVNSNYSGRGYIYRSKWTTFFLCFFLGAIGAHRFYVGKIGTGLLYLLTLGFGGFGILLDFILILIGGFRDKAGQPLAA
jgi:hypothetical protein